MALQFRLVKSYNLPKYIMLQFNVAIEHGPFIIDDLPIINGDFP